MTFIRTLYRQNQHLWRHFGDKMSPGNQGVFQLLKEMAFRRILVFYNSRKWSHFGGAMSLFWSFRLRQLFSPLLGLFRLAPGFVKFDHVVPRPLRRRSTQSLQRIRMRLLVRPGPVELRIDPDVNRRLLLRTI